MKKALLISNIADRFTNFIIPSIKILKKMNYEVHTCANYTGFKDNKKKYDIKMHQIDFVRNPFHLKNIKAYKQLLKLMKSEKFDVVHCNTPIGGLLGRICAQKAKVPKVIYTAHGFHFYKGAPLFNNTILKLAEKIMAHWTDAIITMNQEDYEAAKKFESKSKCKVYFIHGVGINLDDYRNIDKYRISKRKELGIKDDEIVMISMGDLIKRKNYKTAIEAVAKTNNSKIKYLICGEGPEKDNLIKLTNELGIREQIEFLGFREDIKELLSASDIFLFTTLQEGLPRSLMEAMASGLPCIASKIRGNVDLIEDGKGGYLCKKNDAMEFSMAINKCNKENRIDFGKRNVETIKKYSNLVVEKEIERIYSEILKE